MEKRQKFQIMTYNHISQAFMTKDELMGKYGIFERDLPKGSKALHREFEQQRDRIQVNKDLIHRTRWCKVRVVQSKQNLDKSKCNNGRFEISEDRFKQLAIAALDANDRLTPMAHIKFRQNRYYVELLLPVWIPEFS
eukprot:TRINITY_DN2486_c0_g1_i1.p1 TRINITY_DN2486_c0_g1~~TRINITY_DN2486_c0_g1_i1.p1  ORF type:complete len:137 (+),score=42.05 TRINITY_DN2486_c0_g1_i1:22-432(+)